MTFKLDRVPLACSALGSWGRARESHDTVSLFQAFGQRGRSKKRAQDEQGLVNKLGGRGIKALEGPSLLLYQTPLVARRPAAFDKPIHGPRAWNSLRHSQEVCGQT